MSKQSIKITFEVSEQTVADTLTSGLEGGTNYWAAIAGYVEPKTVRFKSDPKKVYRHIDYPMNDGAVVLQDCETGKKYKLTRKKLERAVGLMAEKYVQAFSDMVSESGDATTGDILVQLAIFGDVIYG